MGGTAPRTLLVRRTAFEDPRLVFHRSVDEGKKYAGNRVEKGPGSRRLVYTEKYYILEPTLPVLLTIRTCNCAHERNLRRDLL